MITQVCNLSCEGCTNYSDLYHKGYVKWEDGKKDLEKWLEKVDIPDFGIMGGEPLINPQAKDWIIGVRELLPESQIRFTTNGLLLHKHLDIIDLMHELGNCVFKITVHTPNNTQLTDTIDKIFSKYQWKNVIEYGINRWKTTNNLRLQINYPVEFVKTFKGTYNNMLPHNSNSIEAFDYCCQQTCPLLYNGKIYKCSTAGLLKDTLLNNSPHTVELWKDLIDNGIDVDSDITSFLNNFGKPNKICSQCPTVHNTTSVLNHTLTVTTK